LGGFVKPAGEYYAREDEIKDSGEFAAKPWYARSFMVFAGAGMNYALAFVIFFFVVLIMGLPISDPKLVAPKVGEVLSGYPAQNSGLEKGDLIISVNKIPVASWEELVKNIASSNDSVALEYKRANEILTTEIPLGEDKKIGISVEPVYKKAGVFASIKIAAHQCYYWTALSLKTIGEKLWRRQAPEVAGPIGIFEIVGKSVHSGVEDYFFLIGLISVAIGMFNLFPIPILDGGHILFFIIEAIRGKRVREKTLSMATMSGACFLIFLVFYATYSDISRIAKRGKISKTAQTEIMQTDGK
jgi:regulator of sigma E protease